MNVYLILCKKNSLAVSVVIVSLLSIILTWVPLSNWLLSKQIHSLVIVSLKETLPFSVRRITVNLRTDPLSVNCQIWGITPQTWLVGNTICFSHVLAVSAVISSFQLCTRFLTLSSAPVITLTSFFILPFITIPSLSLSYISFFYFGRFPSFCTPFWLLSQTVIAFQTCLQSLRSWDVLPTANAWGCSSARGYLPASGPVFLLHWRYSHCCLQDPFQSQTSGPFLIFSFLPTVTILAFT